MSTDQSRSAACFRGLSYPPRLAAGRRLRLRPVRRVLPHTPGRASPRPPRLRWRVALRRGRSGAVRPAPALAGGAARSRPFAHAVRRRSARKATARAFPAALHSCPGCGPCGGLLRSCGGATKSATPATASRSAARTSPGRVRLRRPSRPCAAGRHRTRGARLWPPSPRSGGCSTRQTGPGNAVSPFSFPPLETPFPDSPFMRITPKGANRRGTRRGFIHAHATPPFGLPGPACRVPPPFAPQSPQGRARWSGGRAAPAVATAPTASRTALSRRSLPLVGGNRLENALQGHCRHPAGPLRGLGGPFAAPQPPQTAENDLEGLQMAENG